MSELIVITGPPGAGKSTIAPLVSAGFPLSALMAGDNVFAFLDRGYREPWRPEAHCQNTVVTSAAAAAAGRFVLGGYAVIYEGVVGPWFLDDFLSAAGLLRLNYALILPPEEDCVRRVANREGHGFNDLGATRHMHAQFAGADVDPRHLVDGRSAEAVAATIQRRVADGSLVYLGFGGDPSLGAGASRKLRS